MISHLPSREDLRQSRIRRAHAIAQSGGLNSAIGQGAIESVVDLTCSEAIVLGLLKQGVRRFLTVLGHGSTEVGEVLRIYAEAGLVEAHAMRSEISASHAATALRWTTGEKAAVVTSIGPGALQAMAASLAPASNGIGVWYLLGDETTEDEGYNMQQIPRSEQAGFLKLFSSLGPAYSLHTPFALPTALRRGLNCVDSPYRASPFYLLMPMNTQAQYLQNFNLNELPEGTIPRFSAAPEAALLDEAGRLLGLSSKTLVRIGGGAREAGPELLEFLELCDAVAVTSPLASGVIPYHSDRNMTVGGSKGSICGNYAMEEAETLVVIGSRSVCQSDSSRTAYPNVKNVISINSDLNDATHYNRAIPLIGDAREILRILNRRLCEAGISPRRSDWSDQCSRKKREWIEFKRLRYDTPTLFDEMWGKEVLTQPAAIQTALSWAREKRAVSFFDAGDVQANGFQIAEDDRIGQTITETGASYMGFASSALMATALASQKFFGLTLTGDGSFTMCPQILIEGVEHKAWGCLLLLDNRRMAAITGLQKAQYEQGFATNDSVEVDYVAWANSVKGVKGIFGGASITDLKNALDQAYAHPGLSLIHLPVYFGDNPLGGLGAWGRWNVGNWCETTQALRHKIGL